jgi:hypothetical protein
MQCEIQNPANLPTQVSFSTEQSILEMLSVIKLVFMTVLFALEAVKSQTRRGTGRIHPKGYVYPILYPKIFKKHIILSFFWSRIFWGYNILILGISKLSYPYPILHPRIFSREHEVLARLLYPLCCCCSCCCWIVTHVQQKDTRWRYCFTQNFVVFLDMVSYWQNEHLFTK